MSATKVRVDIYEKVTARICEMLEAGTAPWRKPWVTPAGETRNIKGNHYRGCNAFITGCQGYSDPRWLTYKQAQALGGNVRKGERGTPVVYWDRFNPKDENGERDKSRSVLFAKGYTVFNVEQCDGLDLEAVEPLAQRPELPRIEACEETVSAWLDRPQIEHGGNRACYWPMMDRVSMPHRRDFHSAEAYYSVLFHELVHSTGHENRLNRKLSGDFGSHAYSKEELIAEMGATMLCAAHGIEGATIDNSAAYLASWLKVLKSNPKWIVSAAQQAQKAADMIRGIKASAYDKAA